MRYSEQVLKKDFTILLVDTEGIDSASAEKKNDISLLVLTILLSSYFIFNTLSVPKQAQLEELQYVQLEDRFLLSIDQLANNGSIVLSDIFHFVDVLLTWLAVSE